MTGHTIKSVQITRKVDWKQSTEAFPFCDITCHYCLEEKNCRLLLNVFDENVNNWHKKRANMCKFLLEVPGSFIGNPNRTSFPYTSSITAKAGEALSKLSASFFLDVAESSRFVLLANP
jgi:hypothetical protein